MWTCSNRHAYCIATYCYSHGNTVPDADLNPNSNCHANPNADAHIDTYTNANGHPDAYRNENAHTNCYSDTSPSDCNSKPDSYAHPHEGGL